MEGLTAWQAEVIHRLLKKTVVLYAQCWGADAGEYRLAASCVCPNVLFVNPSLRPGVHNGGRAGSPHCSQPLCSPEQCTSRYVPANNRTTLSRSLVIRTPPAVTAQAICCRCSTRTLMSWRSSVDQDSSPWPASWSIPAGRTALSVSVAPCTTQGTSFDVGRRRKLFVYIV